MHDRTYERQKSERQWLSQEAVTGSDASMVEAFDQLHPRPSLRLDLPINPDTDSLMLRDELRKTVRNHAIELKLQDVRISAAQVGILTNMTHVMETVLNRETVEQANLKAGSEVIPSVYPSSLRAYVERLTGITSYASAPSVQDDEAFLYSHTRMSLLHERARRIYSLFEVHKDAPRIPPRLLRFEPEYTQLFDEEEKLAILREEMSPQEVAGRLFESKLHIKNNSDAQQINAVLILSTIFAGTHAIEEKYLHI